MLDAETLRALEPIDKTEGSGWVLWRAHPRQGVYFTRLAGKVTTEAVTGLIEGYEQACSNAPQLDILHDWSEVQGYAPGVRSQFQSWSLSRLETVKSAHVLHASALVAMGVSVVNMALQVNPRLKGSLHAYADKERFEAIVRSFLND